MRAMENNAALRQESAVVGRGDTVGVPRTGVLTTAPSHDAGGRPSPVLHEMAARTQFPRTANEVPDLWTDAVALTTRADVASGNAGPYFTQPADAQDWHTAVDDAPLYLFDPHTADVVAQAAESYPLAEEQAQRLEHVSAQPPGYVPRIMQAIVAFQRPSLFMAVGREWCPLSAIAWNVGISTRYQEVWLSIRGLDLYG